MPQREWNLKFNYGISLAEYDALVKEQNGLCAVCNQPETEKLKGVVKRLTVDHRHSDKIVRGLLCTGCNRGIGQLREDPVILQNAINYLTKRLPSAQPAGATP